MAVIVSLLRGVNIGGHHKMGMGALRALYESLGLRDVQTCLQSGNVVFRTNARDLGALTKRIEKGIEATFGFHSAVVLRTTAELRDVIAQCPFASRGGLDPAKLAVTFLAGDVLYNYFPEGFGQTKVRLPAAGTSRNWNTVRKLLALAEEMEARTARARG